jgi:scyllo-inositol 2-dehydrogenase (NADP+)
MERQIRTGIASFGMSGKVFHAPLLFHNRHYSLQCIVERTKNEVASYYPAVSVLPSTDQLINDPSIELVIVNTPDPSHFDIAKQCLEAGKHVVVEKPFTQTSNQAALLTTLARQHRTTLTVFQNRRWDGDFLTVQDLIRKGTLGTLIEFESRWDRYRPSIQTGSWKEEAALGTGLLYNLGSHMIDQAIVLFGMPDAVTSHLRTFRDRGSIDDWFELRLHYAAHAVSVKASYLAASQAPRFVLHGTNGSFVKYGLDPQEEALKQGEDPRSHDWGKEEERLWGELQLATNGELSSRKVETLRGNYNLFYDNLYEHIIFGNGLAVKPEEALHVITIIEAAMISNASARTVPLR